MGVAGVVNEAVWDVGPGGGGDGFCGALTDVRVGNEAPALTSLSWAAS